MAIVGHLAFVVWCLIHLTLVLPYNISDFDIPYEEDTATPIEKFNHYILPLGSTSILDIVGIRRITVEDRFLHQLVVAVDKVGLPGKPFNFVVSWTDSFICTPIQPHLFSNSWNGSDVFFIPKRALRFDIDHDGCGTGDVYGIIGFGEDSPIWKYFSIATLNVYPLSRSKKGEITLGKWNTHAFQTPHTKLITVRCQPFPSVCSTAGTIFGNMSVVVLFTLGGHSIMLGADVYRIFELYHQYMPLLSVDINGIILEFDDLVEIDTTFADNSPEMKSPYLLIAPAWFQLHKPKIHRCPVGLCPNGNELIIGTLVADLSVVLNHNDSTIIIGQRSHPDQTESTAINILLFFILFLIGHVYLNPQSRFPPFLNHEALSIANSQSKTAPSVTQPPSAYPPSPAPLDANTLTHTPLDMLGMPTSSPAFRNRLYASTGARYESSSQQQQLRWRGSQQTDARSVPGSETYVVHRLYDADTESVFKPELWIFEFIGWSFCFVILESMWFAFNITRRIQLFIPHTLPLSTVYGELGIEIYLGIVFNATLFIHLVLMIVSAPIATWLASTSPVFQAFVLPLLDQYPHLCLLLRLYVYESELGLALWVCLLAGQVVGAFGLIIVIIGIYYSIAGSVYLLRYFFHFQIRRHIALSVFIVLFYGTHISLLYVYILYPTVVTLWNEEDSTTVHVLMTLTLWIALFVISAIYVWKVLVSDISLLENLDPGYNLQYDAETSTYHWIARIDSSTEVKITPPEEPTGSVYGT
jgi:hypothetical protein